MTITYSALLKNDFYPTPFGCVHSLNNHLDHSVSFIEPCVGDGRLVSHLETMGHRCVASFDLPVDVMTTQYDVKGVDYFITNPPWTRSILHPTIDNLRKQLPTWLLFDASWAFTKQAKPYLDYCSKIVTIGRVKWIEGSKHTGKDDCAWYLFVNFKTSTRFYGKI
jgi:hypothetical protein